MADEKTVVKGKEEKTGFFSKVGKFFKNLPSAIARPFKNMWHELRKVTWPSRQDVIKYSIIVLAFLVFFGVVIGLLDFGSGKLVEVITPAAVTDTVETPDAPVDGADEALVDDAEGTVDQQPAEQAPVTDTETDNAGEADQEVAAEENQQ